MIIGIKDASKLFGISIIACCAVLVCTMFANYYLDIIDVKHLVSSAEEFAFYDAQVAQSRLVCMITGGCLLMTSVVMLLFYIKNYLDTHRKELGILKALGYSNFYIAKHFVVFGLSVLTGCMVGFGGAFLLLPTFYELQSKDSILPTFPLRFHPSVAFGFILLPTILFALLSVLYAYWKLHAPVLTLLQNAATTYRKPRSIKTAHAEKTRLYHAEKPHIHHTNKPLTHQSNNKKAPMEKPFLNDLRSSTLRQKKSLAFFMTFSAFCFSAMTQMSFRMKDLSSLMMGAMMLIIGLVLSFTTLYLAITTVIGGNRQSLAIMRAFGYSDGDCRRAILDCYRPLSYVGFAIGTLYQHFLLELMVSVVYANVDTIPTYEFDFGLMMLSLLVFLFVYEIVMTCYARTLRRISLKEIMLS